MSCCLFFIIFVSPYERERDSNRIIEYRNTHEALNYIDANALPLIFCIFFYLRVCTYYYLNLPTVFVCMYVCGYLFLFHIWLCFVFAQRTFAILLFPILSWMQSIYLGNINTNSGYEVVIMRIHQAVCFIYTTMVLCLPFNVSRPSVYRWLFAFLDIYRTLWLPFVFFLIACPVICAT